MRVGPPGSRAPPASTASFPTGDRYTLRAWAPPSGGAASGAFHASQARRRRRETCARRLVVALETAIPCPAPRPRRRRGGPSRTEITLRLQLVTPVLGGAWAPLVRDEVDTIRAPSIRGALRFWWRALYAPQAADAAELHRQEAAIWGHAAGDHGGRSLVEVRVDQVEQVAWDTDRLGPASVEGYALFPARPEGAPRDAPWHPRLRPGARFRLTLCLPPEVEDRVRHALRAWLLFGGYGARTRRGLGTLVPCAEREVWLPQRLDREALARLFGSDPFAAVPRGALETPVLAGSALAAGPEDADPLRAWRTALGWLREFRQGTAGPRGQRAREPGADLRPSRSNWPEADAVRLLVPPGSGDYSHTPRLRQVVGWPRAGFGRPIVGRFQTRDRHGGSYKEPPPFELRWRQGEQQRTRLASPLIVKALPLAHGRFQPVALWLTRALPPGGEVVLFCLQDKPAPVSGSARPLDAPLLPPDAGSDFFGALRDQPDLRRAFLAWLRQRPGGEVEAATLNAAHIALIRSV
jgi:CRISPR-associated protein Cmr1